MNQTNGVAHLRSAAELAMRMLERVSGEGGVVQQIVQGQGDWHLLADAEAHDLADLLEAMAEKVRSTRATIDAPSASTVESAAAAHATMALPFNRKERFFTGTVLPQILAADDFRHLPRFMRLCGLEPGDDFWMPLDGTRRLQFFSEYGFAESVFTDHDRARWGETNEADTPDIVIATDDWLLAVEAKVYHDPSGRDLTAQMDRQARLVAAWQEKLGFSADRVRHVLLLPERLRDRAGQLDYDVITWEQVVKAYDRVGPAYWVSLLNTALERHEQLESRPLGFGQNADSRMTGADIVAEFAEGDLEFAWVGRQHGLKGAPLQSDLATGAWRTKVYEVAAGSAAPNKNWFSVADFVEAIGAASSGQESAD